MEKGRELWTIETKPSLHTIESRGKEAMPRSVWSGVISFSMVGIPVKLYKAAVSKDVPFHLLHRKCGNRLEYVRWGPVCAIKVELADAVRGYEYEKDQHVALTEEDFDRLPLPSKDVADTSAFVDITEIHPIYYENSYYLTTEEGGATPFALLARVLSDKRMAAIAKIALHGKERPCVLRASNNMIVLETLFYPDEVRIDPSLKSSIVRLSERELSMASTLVELLTKTFARIDIRWV